MRFDEYIPSEEIRLMDELAGRSRMEQDEIIGEREWTGKNSKAE